VFDTSRPDGTPQKLLDVSGLTKLGWIARTDLRAGLAAAYQDFQTGDGERDLRAGVHEMNERP
jgi:GDP-L-fucose synthase